jgi:hypothetical protein
LETTVDIGRIEGSLRQRSKALLGSQYRAEVAAFIGLREGPYWARHIAGSLRIPENKVSSELNRFFEQNLLEASEDATYDRRRLLIRAPESSSYWQAAAGMLRAAARSESLLLGIPEHECLAAYLRAVHGEHVTDLDATDGSP